MGKDKSQTVTPQLGMPQGSVLGSLLFAVYWSPVSDVITRHGGQYHQYADDTQLHIAMQANISAERLFRMHDRCLTLVPTERIAAQFRLIRGTGRRHGSAAQGGPVNCYLWGPLLVSNCGLLRI